MSLSSIENPGLNMNKVIAEMECVQVMKENNVSIPITSPIKTGDINRISSWYGKRVHPIIRRRRMHHGIDISAEEGTYIVSTAKGNVYKVCRSRYGYGNRVIIQHEDGYQTLYAHMNNITVEEGDIVVRGSKLGTVGSTGLSTGNHLHYEIIRNNKSIDPLSLYNGKKEDYLHSLKTFEDFYE